MKKVLLTLLGIIVVVGILAGAGFVGYRMGYNHGAVAVSNRAAQLPQQNRGFDQRGMPMMRGFGDDFGLRGMPMHNFGNGFERGFGPGGFGMMGRGRGGFGFFGLFGSLLHLAVPALIIWVAYKLIKNSGWTLTRQPAPVAKVETSEVGPKNE
jgi:hypothetical protein